MDLWKSTRVLSSDWTLFRGIELCSLGDLYEIQSNCLQFLKPKIELPTYLKIKWLKIKWRCSWKSEVEKAIKIISDLAREPNHEQVSKHFDVVSNRALKSQTPERAGLENPLGEWVSQNEGFKLHNVILKWRNEF